MVAAGGALRRRVRHGQDPLRRPRLGHDPHRDPADDRGRARRAAQRRGRRAASDALAAVGVERAPRSPSHGVKAGLRLAVNLSPDPVTTATASLTEDFLVGGVVVLIVTHPWAALALSMTLLAIGLIGDRLL